MSNKTCALCGKETILQKSWEEKVETSMGVSVLKYAQYVCPDEKCQARSEKAVAEKHKQARDRQNLADIRRDERMGLRTKNAKT